MGKLIAAEHLDTLYEMLEQCPKRTPAEFKRYKEIQYMIDCEESR